MNKLMRYALALTCATSLCCCSSEDNSDGMPDSNSSNSNVFYTDGIESFSDPYNITGDKFKEFSDNPFVSANEEKTSTFSVDADGASYAITRKYISIKSKVYKESVRIEEFLNYFTFDYPNPDDGNQVAINSEIGICPWNERNYLLRLGIKGKTIDEKELPPSNLVFLVDVSGSMSSNEKLPLLKECLNTLAKNLNPEDRISIITYSGNVRRVLESTPAKEYEKIASAINELRAEGSTNGGFALKIAYNEALNNFIKGGNNRIILGTDGDFNVGVTSTEELLELVETYADKGIYLTACGFGMGNLNDEMMEAISNRGNGTYEYIDSEKQMLKVFLHERSKFFSVASDAKCQITFNPDYVDSYRLIGYENRVMKNSDFKNDKKDAGEIGAGQTITALYEIVPTSKQENISEENNKIATFDFRYKPALGEESIPLTKNILTTDLKETKSENFTFAAGVAEYGMILRESKYKGNSTFESAKDLVSKSLTFDPNGYRSDLLELISIAEKL